MSVTPAGHVPHRIQVPVSESSIAPQAMRAAPPRTMATAMARSNVLIWLMGATTPAPLMVF